MLKNVSEDLNVKKLYEGLNAPNVYESINGSQKCVLGPKMCIKA